MTPVDAPPRTGPQLRLLHAAAATTTAAIFALAASGLAPPAAPVSPGAASSPVSATTAAAALLPNLPQRLADLDPARPMAYFELAEELLPESADRDARQLARELLVIAFDLFRRSAAADPPDAQAAAMARSCCLALAALTPSTTERAWLVAVGDTLWPRGSEQADAAARIPPPVSDQTALELTTAMGLARAGDGRRAESYLNREGVRQLLAASQSIIASGRAGATGSVEAAIAQWPACPTCKNKRIVIRAAQADLCPHCKGNPGPTLTDAELVRQIRAESLLLRGVYRSWSAQMVADDGEPLRDPDPDKVAARYGIDPRSTLYRNSTWVAP